MSLAKTTASILLVAACIGVLVLSQLGSMNAEGIYVAVSQFLHIDIMATRVHAPQISNAGHIVAGFVLYVLGQLVFRRCWVLPLVLIFFLVLEAAQYFSLDRQPDVLDVLRGWSGIVLGFLLVLLIKKVKKFILKSDGVDLADKSMQERPGTQAECRRNVDNL